LCGSSRVVPNTGTWYVNLVRVIAYANLRDYWYRHPETQIPLVRWFDLTEAADWTSVSQVAGSVGGAKAINGERVRFAIHGGDYRLIASFDFRRGVAYIKFLGTHAEYDRVDAATVSQF